MTANENMNFLELLNDIDESYIYEADSRDIAVSPVFVEPTQRGKRPVFAIAGIAACFALVFAAGIAVKNNIGTEITQPPLNVPDTVSETVVPVTDEPETTSETAAADTEPVTEQPENTIALTFDDGRVYATPIVITDPSGENHYVDRRPMDKDKLLDFRYEELVEDFRNYRENDEYDRYGYNYIKSIGDDELTEVFIRAKVLARICCDAEHLQSVELDLSEGNNRIYIFIEDALFGYESYCETGIKYDSFYDALCEVFTEESVNKMLYETFPFYYSYEDGLWAKALALSTGIWHSDIEFVKETDTEVEFNLICYAPFEDWYFEEFDPEKRDQYKYVKIRNRFVKTEEGWRAVEVETKCISSLVGMENFPEDYYG